MDLNIQVYVPVYLWVYSKYLTFCNSNCYLKGLYKAVAFASAVRHKVIKVRTREERWAQSEERRAKLKPMRINWNVWGSRKTLKDKRSYKNK